MNLLARSFDAESYRLNCWLKRKRGSGRTFPRVAGHKYTASIFESKGSFFVKRRRQSWACRWRSKTTKWVPSGGGRKPVTSSLFSACFPLVMHCQRQLTHVNQIFDLFSLAPTSLDVCKVEARHKNRQWPLLSVAAWVVRIRNVLWMAPCTQDGSYGQLPAGCDSMASDGTNFSAVGWLRRPSIILIFYYQVHLNRKLLNYWLQGPELFEQLTIVELWVVGWFKPTCLEDTSHGQGLPIAHLQWGIVTSELWQPTRGKSTPVAIPQHLCYQVERTCWCARLRILSSPNLTDTWMQRGIKREVC